MKARTISTARSTERTDLVDIGCWTVGAWERRSSAACAGVEHTASCLPPLRRLAGWADPELVDRRVPKLVDFERDDVRNSVRNNSRLLIHAVHLLRSALAA